MEPEVVELVPRSEFPHLEGKVYLDHAGAAVYTKSHVEALAQENSVPLPVDNNKSVGIRPILPLSRHHRSLLCYLVSKAWLTSKFNSSPV